MKLRRSLVQWACLFALGAGPLVGCQEVVDTVELSVTTAEAPSLDGDIFRGPPLEGVELCEADTTNCETTDANGFAQIRLPANQLVSWTLSKDGYGPYLVGDVTDETFAVATSPPWPMMSDELLADFSEINMLPYPWTGGWLILRAFPERAEVTFDLVDETATAYYTDEEGMATLGLTATTSHGQGGFFEVPAGEHQVEFGGAATNCAPGIAWPGDAANQIKVSVRVGYLSFGDVNCD